MIYCRQLLPLEDTPLLRALGSHISFLYLRARVQCLSHWTRATMISLSEPYYMSCFPHHLLDETMWASWSQTAWMDRTATRQRVAKRERVGFSSCFTVMAPSNCQMAIILLALGALLHGAEAAGVLDDSSNARSVHDHTHEKSNFHMKPESRPLQRYYRFPNRQKCLLSRIYRRVKGLHTHSV